MDIRPQPRRPFRRECNEGGVEQGGRQATSLSTCGPAVKPAGSAAGGPGFLLPLKQKLGQDDFSALGPRPSFLTEILVSMNLL